MSALWPETRALRVTDPLALARDDLRDFGGYRSARSDAHRGRVWLNANESPWASSADAGGSLRRYPDPQPDSLRQALADAYGCRPEQLLAGRGSDEGIDLLVRAFCRPGRDAVVISPPTFGMYAVSARLNGTAVFEVPLQDACDGFACDFEKLAQAVESSDAKLVFVCSPGNPSGTLIPLERIRALAQRLEGRALVVVDEAYIEYASSSSAIALIDGQRNVAVLRTMSKAHALAAARIGTVIADETLIALLRRCQAPYPLPGPSVDLARRALAPAALEMTAARIAIVRQERDRLGTALRESAGVRRVYPSQANFLLVRFDDPQAVFDALLASGIVVRDMRAMAGLGDALRITVGNASQNAEVLECVASAGAAA